MLREQDLRPYINVVPTHPCFLLSLLNRIRISLLHNAMRDCIFFNGYTGRSDYTS